MFTDHTPQPRIPRAPAAVTLMPPKLRFPIACVLSAFVTAGILSSATAHADRVYIDPNYPVKGPSNLSPPNVEVTNECSTHVYVDSFVPGASVEVFVNGVREAGPIVEKLAFHSFTLAHRLNTNDKVTAKQTVNGVTSHATNPPMVAGKMPAHLPPPQVGTGIYACGRIAPVNGLTSGVTVQVRDRTAGAPVGSGYTPNDWGSNWDPVSTMAGLKKGHAIVARQLACTGAASGYSAIQPVQADPSPVTPPQLEPPVIGDDTVTLTNLFTGSSVQVFQGPVIGSGYSTGATNWAGVSPSVAKSPPAAQVTAQQALCTPSVVSTGQTPVSQLTLPQLVSPICPDAKSGIVADTTINATLVLLKNGAIVGYGGAAPGDVPLDIAPPAVFAQGDKVQVIEYIGSVTASSNTVIVGCTNVTTYHNDSQRTGWNPHENTLTPANVRPATFGLLPLARNPVPLDDQVDAQPLVVTKQNIEGQGVHTVVYVVTENNTVYAIDSFSGAILLQTGAGGIPSLGAPVPLPLGCNNNAPHVGITGTPTIDLTTRTMFVVVYTLSGGVPIYELHALDLSTLLDKSGSPQPIGEPTGPSHTLQDGSSFPFNAVYQRQRAALLQANGNVYAGFSSFCDYDAPISRGWLLGWNTGSLTILPANELTDQLNPLSSSLATVDCTYGGNHPCFLSSIWMSGYGIAADLGGNLFFTTGNSASGSYDPTLNISESAVKLSADLTTVVDKFTPANQASLDTGDQDYSAGGLMVLPDQPGPVPHLAVGAGKDGRMFILNRDNMGGYQNPDVPANVGIGGCHCGPSYYQGSDAIGRVVSSGDITLQTWTVDTTKTPALQNEAQAGLASWLSGEDGGFFTSVSSNGTTADTATIWALGRPIGNDNTITLYAFDGTAAGTSLTEIWHAAAGSWPNLQGNANLVPTVANGRVYVASYGQLAIFGLRSLRRPGRIVGEPRILAQSAPILPTPPGARYWGVIKSVHGERVTITLREGRLLDVDLSTAAKDGTTLVPIVGHPVAVSGTLNDRGVLKARTMQRVKGPSTWGPDSAK
jgi:hypothetical protein